MDHSFMRPGMWGNYSKLTKKILRGVFEEKRKEMIIRKYGKLRHENDDTYIAARSLTLEMGVDKPSYQLPFAVCFRSCSQISRDSR